MKEKIKSYYVCLFVCWVISFLTQNKTTMLFPEMALIRVAHRPVLKVCNTHLRDPDHQSRQGLMGPVSSIARNQLIRELGRVFKE